MKLLDVSTPKNPAATCLVDEEDFADLASLKWYVGRHGYVARTRSRGSRPRIEYLHRRLMGEPDGLVDHANGNKLDNRRANLRLATRQLNAANMRSKSRCGLKGVTFHPQSGRWRARLMVDGVSRSLGMFDTPQHAHDAYVLAAKSAFGNFASSG